MPGHPWSAHWVEAADRIIDDGDGHLGEDRLPDARDCYLRASEYYRLAVSGTEPGTAEHRSWSNAQVSAFRAALPLLPHPGSPFAIVSDSQPVAGYLFRSAVGPSTLTALCPATDRIPPESLFLLTAVPVLELGLNCAIFGRVREIEFGGVMPPERRATDRMIESVVEWVRRQPAIDPAGILWPPANRHSV